MKCDNCEDVCPTPYGVDGYPELHFCSQCCFDQAQDKGWAACMEEKEATANKDQDACSHCGTVSMTSTRIAHNGLRYCSMECSVLGEDKATANNERQFRCATCLSVVDIKSPERRAGGIQGSGILYYCDEVCWDSRQTSETAPEATANKEALTCDQCGKSKPLPINGTYCSIGCLYAWGRESSAATANNEPDPASPLSQQVGGDHYLNMAIQPFEYIYRNRLGFGEGCVIKYVSRWRDKNGVEDLRKAKQVLELMIAEEES